MHKILFLLFRKVVRVFYGYEIGRFSPIAFSYNFLISHFKDRNVIAEVNGNKMFLDTSDSLNLHIWGTHEPLTTKLVKKYIKKGNVALDIGAHIGYFTLILAKLVGKEGKVYAFEPDPTNFALLKKNIRLNGYNNVVLVNKAVSDKTGRIKLYLSKDNYDHRIYESHDDRQSIIIETIKLDDYFEKYRERINFIKMDIQGAEGLAIQGMTELFKSKDMIIITEFWPIGLKRSGVMPEEYLESLIGIGFKLFYINELEKRIDPTNIPKLMQICTDEKYTNILCIK